MTPALRDQLNAIMGPLYSPTKLNEILALVEDQDALETLRALVFQLQGSGYQDRHGNPIERNTCYQDALALVELRKKP